MQTYKLVLISKPELIKEPYLFRLSNLCMTTNVLAFQIVEVIV